MMNDDNNYKDDYDNNDEDDYDNNDEDFKV